MNTTQERRRFYDKIENLKKALVELASVEQYKTNSDERNDVIAELATNLTKLEKMAQEYVEKSIKPVMSGSERLKEYLEKN